jgi:hypothetical protein
MVIVEQLVELELDRETEVLEKKNWNTYHTSYALAVHTVTHMPNVRQRLGKYIPATTNTQATIE